MSKIKLPPSVAGGVKIPLPQNISRKKEMEKLYESSYSTEFTDYLQDRYKPILEHTEFARPLAKRKKKQRRYAPKVNNIAKLESEEYKLLLHELSKIRNTCLDLKEEYRLYQHDKDRELINGLINKKLRPVYKRIQLLKTVQYKTILLQNIQKVWDPLT